MKVVYKVFFSLDNNQIDALCSLEPITEPLLTNEADIQIECNRRVSRIIALLDRDRSYLIQCHLRVFDFG
jgi:hypothetical protein